MDVSLSDLLVCPRCGPTYGLVLLPYEVADRRVRRGVLGCANCRERYPVEAGVADLRTERGAAEPVGPAADAGEDAGEWGGGSEEAPVRLAGLMDLADAAGTVLVAGPGAVHARALASLVEGVEVVVVTGGEGPVAGGPGVSGLRVRGVLPFRSGSLRGVALTGGFAGLLEEGARVLGRQGQLVLDPAPARAPDRLADAGLTVLAEEGRVVVAGRRS